MLKHNNDTFINLFFNHNKLSLTIYAKQQCLSGITNFYIAKMPSAKTLSVWGTC